MTVTDSPTSKSTSTDGPEPPPPSDDGAAAPALVFSGCFSAGSTFGSRNFRTSSSDSGDGREVAPTKPVTPGVLRTAPHDWSFSSMRTRM